MPSRLQLDYRGILPFRAPQDLRVQQGTLLGRSEAEVRDTVVDVQRLSAFSQSVSTAQNVLVGRNGQGFFL